MTSAGHRSDHEHTKYTTYFWNYSLHSLTSTYLTNTHALQPRHLTSALQSYLWPVALCCKCGQIYWSALGTKDIAMQFRPLEVSMDTCEVEMEQIYKDVVCVPHQKEYLGIWSICCMVRSQPICACNNKFVMFSTFNVVVSSHICINHPKLPIFVYFSLIYQSFFMVTETL